KEFHFLEEKGILCRYKNEGTRRNGTNEVQEFRVIPISLRTEVLELLHGFTHFGIGRMVKTLESSGYKWNGMYRDVRSYVLSCRACATCKRGLYRHKAELKPLAIHFP